jgi:hypothetical protein
VNEIVDVAKLQLDGGANVVVPDNGREFLYDPKTAIHIAPVIIGELENEQLVENVAIDHR